MDNLIYVMLPSGALFIIFTALLLIFIYSRAVNFLFCGVIVFAFLMTSAIVALFMPGDHLWQKLLLGIITSVLSTVLFFVFGSALVHCSDLIKEAKKKKLTFKAALALLVGHIRKVKKPQSVSE